MPTKVIRDASIIVVCTAFGLVAVLAAMELSHGWPPLETPPRQGEALDKSEYAAGRFLHSDEASVRLIREPQNTWSNLAFVAVGALLASGSTMRINRMLGWALVCVGIGSFVYHASASRTLRHLDVGAMYGLFFLMSATAVAACVGRVRIFIEKHAPAFAIGAAAFGVGAMLLRNVVVFGVKPLELTFVTASAATIYGGTLLLTWLRSPTTIAGLRVAACLVLFGLAVASQIGDRPGNFLCAPGGMIQGHAVWHLLSAAALLIGTRILDGASPSVDSRRNEFAHSIG